VHLEQHLAPEGAGSQRVVDADHRDLDQVRRRTLDRGVGGDAFAKRADVEVPIAKLRDVAPPMKDRFDIPVFARILDLRVEIRADAAKAREIRLDECLRFGVRNS
jgi:hypothetical protein